MEKTESSKSVSDRVWEKLWDMKRDDVEVARENIRYLCEMFEMMRNGEYESFKYHFKIDS